MKKPVRISLLLMLIVVVAIQFFQPAPNTARARVYQADFNRTYNVPAEINQVLKTACYDCHSHHTNYLWYDYLQPARWMVQSHITRAKKELNFNEWKTYPLRKRERLLRAMAEQIKTGQMPLRSYTLMHKDAILSQTQIESITRWLKEQR